MKLKNFLIYAGLFVLLGCSMNSEKGQVVGFVTHFSKQGVFWKSYEAEVNSSQTGMTSTAKEMDLSIDNDNEDQELVNELDSAQKYGWKVQIDYSQSFGVNCCCNRGQSSKFIKKVEVLDKTPLGGIKGEFENGQPNLPIGKHDTIYLVIRPK